jgi:hypothetical protein
MILNKSHFIKSAAFLRLLDEHGQLSLTNLAVGIVLVKIATAVELDFTAISALLTVLGTYTFKRYNYQKHEEKATKTDDDTEKRIKALEEKIEEIKLIASLRK